MKRILVLLFFLTLPLINFSSNGDGAIGVRSISLGHASTCLFDVWAVRNNQGSLGFVKQVEVGSFYENRFLIKELSQTGFALAIPIKKSTIGLCYTSLGYKLYRESQTTLAYGMMLSKTISLGIGLDYLTTKIADLYGEANTFTGSMGLTAKITQQFIVSTHIYNPFRSKITNYNQEKIPTIIKFGLQYTFSKKVFMVAEAEKTSDKNIHLKAGIEYTPATILYLRMGASTSPNLASIGVGVNYHGLKIDMSTAYHSLLGVSPQVGINYIFGTKKSTDSNNSK